MLQNFGAISVYVIDYDDAIAFYTESLDSPSRGTCPSVKGGG